MTEAADDGTRLIRTIKRDGALYFKQTDVVTWLLANGAPLEVAKALLALSPQQKKERKNRWSIALWNGCRG